jgi:hypothetical protein
MASGLITVFFGCAHVPPVAEMEHQEDKTEVLEYGMTFYRVYPFCHPPQARKPQVSFVCAKGSHMDRYYPIQDVFPGHAVIRGWTGMLEETIHRYDPVKCQNMSPHLAEEQVLTLLKLYDCRIVKEKP